MNLPSATSYAQPACVCLLRGRPLRPTCPHLCSGPARHVRRCAESELLCSQLRSRHRLTLCPGCRSRRSSATLVRAAEGMNCMFSVTDFTSDRVVVMHFVLQKNEVHGVVCRKPSRHDDRRERPSKRTSKKCTGL